MAGQRLVNSIEKGIVIDHIQAGMGIKLFRYLNLDKAGFTVVMIMNAASKRMGRKDIIKIQDITDLDYTVIGLIDHRATISVIDGGKIIAKKPLTLPSTVQNVLYCKNPRCVTATEKQMPHIFRLQNAGERIYKCAYCEEYVNGFEL
ncbi:MAG: aspartate carbamoyltransferase regulatory subunit [Oscillospiraceae bacterium]|nr:aspartate carbamoyltransferase regulatory subunit [Oscillospiraceae bacterium]